MILSALLRGKLTKAALCSDLLGSTQKLCSGFSESNEKQEKQFPFVKTLNETPPQGKLTILPTPIGNLQDLSPNIIKALFKADVIGCEDRRVAGKLYTLIKSKKIMEQIVENFGDIGLSSIVLKSDSEGGTHQQGKSEMSETEQNYLFYNYANMNEKSRKKFLRKMSKQDQEQFKIEFLKYRALKLMKKQDQWRQQIKEDKFDEIYGLDSSDMQHIQSQIKLTRQKKGRGLLIPLNTYSQTKMYSMVRMFLETKNVAIVSDAGMPCISDPGWKMVQKFRQLHPQIPIEVIGGPSSVSMMTLLASLSSREGSNSLSGRFQGFAPEEISKMNMKSVEIQLAKRSEFSIHFINSKKLPKKALQLEKVYGEKQRILLANELTKMYERKYHGTIKELNQEIKKTDSFGRNQFTEGVGELSYLIYSDRGSSQTEKEQQVNLQEQAKESKQEPEATHIPRNSLISVSNFLDSVIESEQLHIKEGDQERKRTSLRDLSEMVSSIFAIKISEARKIVYQKKVKRPSSQDSLRLKGTSMEDERRQFSEFQKDMKGQKPQEEKRGRRARKVSNTMPGL